MRLGANVLIILFAVVLDTLRPVYSWLLRRLRKGCPWSVVINAPFYSWALFIWRSIARFTERIGFYRAAERQVNSLEPMLGVWAFERQSQDV